MTSERLRMIYQRPSRLGENFGFAMLGLFAIVWPALMLLDAFGGVL